MDGVILFADDHIYKNPFEEGLYKELRENFPVVGTHNLDLAKRALDSLSTITAFIVDWTFEQGPNRSETPQKLLMENQVYSLIYVYSERDVKNSTEGKKLFNKYGPRIHFRKKNAVSGYKQEIKKIVKDIEKWKKNNQKLFIPHKWVQSIARSSQQIFCELAKADEDWICDLHKTAISDGNEPSIEVIQLFQRLLTEHIIQNNDLIDTIKNLATQNPPNSGKNPQKFAKLFSRIYYSKTIDSSPMTTGDIFKFTKNKKATYSVVVTPECDIKKAAYIDLLVFKKKDFNEFVCRNFQGVNKLSDNIIKKIRGYFNQPETRKHFLPCFPYSRTDNVPAIVDFGNIIKFKKSDLRLNLNNRKYKLNSPYIEQLRQRYLSYQGRVGVSAIPESLKDYNMTSIKFN